MVPGIGLEIRPVDVSSGNGVRFDRRNSVAFYALALGFAFVAALGVSKGIAPLMFVYMFTPLLAVLVLRFLEARRQPEGRQGFLRALATDLALDRPGVRGWTFALLVPPLIYGAVTLAVNGVGVTSYQAAGNGIGPLWLIGFALSIVSALGEEAGWRGYLLPSLLGLGTWPAMLATGALHGLWHFPVILLTPYYHGAGSQWIVLPEFLMVLTLAGVLYGYLRLSTASLWPAVLFHASINESIAFYAQRTRPADPALLEYWGGESGVFTIVAVTLAVLWIRWRWHPSPQAA